MIRWFISLLALSSTANSNTYEIHRSDVDYYEGQIIIDYRLTLSAAPEKVKRLLTDYNNFPKISRLIRKSHLHHEKNNKIILNQELFPCLLGLCYSLDKEQQLFKNNSGSISAVFTPNQRFFESGYEEWKVSSNNSGTVIHYQANVTPAFTIPPFIGKFFIHKFVDDEINFVVKKILSTAS